MCITALKQFDATHNSLQELPSQFGTLQKLEQLYLRHNQLTALPLLKDCVSLKVGLSVIEASDNLLLQR